MSKTNSLETGKAERRVWLVKVPNFVAQRWKTACENSMNGGPEFGQELGKVRITANAAQSTSEFALSLAESMADNIPSEYQMELQPAQSQFHVFCERPTHASVEGRVIQKFDVQPKRGVGQSGNGAVDPVYARLSRERHQKAATKTRTLQVIDDPLAARRASTRHPIAIMAKRKATERAQGHADKRVRQDKDELERRLFSLFERQAQWKFTELVKESQQPAVWLKEVLQGIAVLNKRGPYRDLYEVKKEFRHSAAQPPAERQTS